MNESITMVSPIIPDNTTINIEGSILAGEFIRASLLLLHYLLTPLQFGSNTKLLSYLIGRTIYYIQYICKFNVLPVKLPLLSTTNVDLFILWYLFNFQSVLYILGAITAVLVVIFLVLFLIFWKQKKQRFISPTTQVAVEV